MSPTIALSVGAPCARLGPLTSRNSMKTSQKRRLGRMHHVVVRVGVEPASSLAIAQQAIAFGTLLFIRFILDSLHHFAVTSDG